MTDVSQHVNEELLKENERLKRDLEIAVSQLQLKTAVEQLIQRLINDGQMGFNKLTGIETRLMNIENRLNLLSPGTYVAPTYPTPIYTQPYNQTSTGNF